MAAKFFLVSILDLLLGINFLSPILLVQNSIDSDEVVYLNPKNQRIP